MSKKQEQRITILIDLLLSKPSSLEEILTYLKDYKDIEIAGITWWIQVINATFS